MTVPDLDHAPVHVDRCIEAYATRCRQRIPEFVERHFSLDQTWHTQQPTFWADLLIGPLNSAWAVVYAAAKRVCGGLDTLGVPGMASALHKIPLRLKSGYQQAIETAIARDLLEWDLEGTSTSLPQGLTADLERHPAVQHLPAIREPATGRPIRAALSESSAGRALVSDLAGTTLTIALAWVAFGTIWMGLTEMADRIAQQNARTRLAARFVLGRRAGSVFYTVFRPEASALETAAILSALVAVVAVGAMACTLASDPILRALGLHQRRLAALVDRVERELILLSQKRIKPDLEASSRLQALSRT